MSITPSIPEPSAPFVDVQAYLASSLGGVWEYGTLHLPTGDLHLEWLENPVHCTWHEQCIHLEIIEAIPQRQRIGSRALEALRSYCDMKGIVLYISVIETPDFFSQFDWLHMERGSGTYRPAPDH